VAYVQAHPLRNAGGKCGMTLPDHEPSDHSGILATVAWGGDVNIGRRFNSRSIRPGVMDGLAQIAPLVQADLGIINLECVVATSGEVGIVKHELGTNRNERSPYYFRARPEMLEALLRGGVDLVATANNHSGDYGPEALIEQGQWLDQAGIGYAGSGPNREAAFAPIIRRAGRLNIALFALDATQRSFAADETTPGIAWLDPATPNSWTSIMRPRIEAARAQADIVLVAIHWGRNNRHHPDRLKIAAGRALIDAGADAVMGASAHLLQGVEIYKNRPILHDAGDFFFDSMSRNDKNAGIFTLEMDAAGVRRVVFDPLEASFCQTTSLPLDQAIAATSRFAQKCAALGTVLEVTTASQGIIRLAEEPPIRDRRPPVPAISRMRQSPGALSEPRPEWLADAVPEDALLASPLRVGSLELLGVRMSPQHLDRLGSIHIESWWQLAEPTSVDWRLEFEASPKEPGPIGAWGQGSVHDPCDWMWPTSRWRMGQIYRDSFSLRRPDIRHWLDLTLTLSVCLWSASGRTPRHHLPREIEFSLSPKEILEVLVNNPPQYRIPPPEKIDPTPKILWTANQIQEITGGKWLVKPPSSWFVRSVTNKSGGIGKMVSPTLLAVSSSRTSMIHEIFGTYAGRLWDDHKFLPKVQKSIAGAIVEHPVEGLAPELPLLHVADPIHALMQLGVAARRRLKGHVVAVTGSAGKTSQCHMLMQAMSMDRAVTGNSLINYNSRVGILEAMANAPEDTDVVIIETAISAINAPGFQNIKLLRPDISIITNITISHLPPGGSLEGIARRKANIMEGMAAGSIVILYREIDFFATFKERAQKKDLRLVTFGHGEDADLRLLSYDQRNGQVRARLPDGREIEYLLNAAGDHMALNSLACIGVRLTLGGDLEPFLEGLRTFTPSEGRGATAQLTFNGHSLTVVDESYNANPLSMRAALKTFAGQPRQGRRILVLGDMLELGNDAPRYHRELAEVVRAVKPDRLFLCGELMAALWDELRRNAGSAPIGAHFPTADLLIAEIDDHLADGDLLLLKASNSIGLGRLFAKLQRGGKKG
jgi:UDP-N-acetylmuramoyl-tripeptide--D-alanyl-D-alanine ligase